MRIPAFSSLALSLTTLFGFLVHRVVFDPYWVVALSNWMIIGAQWMASPGELFLVHTPGILKFEHHFWVPNLIGGGIALTDGTRIWLGDK